MAKFKIEELQKEAQEQGWELLSDEYKNLDGDLDYVCANGHTLSLPYKRIRDKYICPICKEFNDNTEMDIIDNPITKEEGIVRTLSFDQSSKVTGYAIFDNNKLIKYGIIEIKGKDAPIRYVKVRKQIHLIIEAWKPDLVVLEDIQLQTEEHDGTKNVITFKILAELLGVLEAYFVENGINYMLANISSWRSAENITGKRRNDKKASAQARVKKCYDIDVTDDIADAILIGRYAIESQKEDEIIHW